jgi:GAF domain-containing protein
MESRLPRFLRFLEIQSADRRIVRQSRLLQILVGIVLLSGLNGVVTSFGRLIAGPSTIQDYLIFIAQIVTLLVFVTLTFSLLHKGRFIAAVNICFIILDLILFSLLVSTEGAGPFHLLLLISVFSIASLQSVRVSIVYLAVILTAVSLYYINSQPDGMDSAISYIQLALLLTLPSWFFANDLRISRDRADRLTNELEVTISDLDIRARQLEQIADVGRVATASLDQEKLIRNSVALIRSQFNFYYVGLYLVNSAGSRLVLQEAVGESGRMTAEKGSDQTIGQVSIVGWVALNRQARIALDVGEDPYFFNNPNLPDTHSEVALPLLARGRLLGVLDVQSRETNAFKEQDISVLQVMADQIAAGIDNARLFQEISDQAGLLAELQTITNLMSQQANTRNALNVLATRAVSLFNADGGGVFLYRPEKDNLKLVVNLNVNDEQVGEILRPGEGLSGLVFAENKTITIDDYEVWEGRSEKFTHVGFHSAVALPLRRQTEPIGVLALTRTQKGQPFKADEVQIAELLAAQVSAVIINNQLIEETRRLIKRERTINQAAAQIRRSLDARTILDTMTGELGNLFGNRTVKARLFPQQEGRSEEKETP